MRVACCVSSGVLRVCVACCDGASFCCSRAHKVAARSARLDNAVLCVNTNDTDYWREEERREEREKLYLVTGLQVIEGEVPKHMHQPIL
jgi:hypothetical protein